MGHVRGTLRPNVIQKMTEAVVRRCFSKLVLFKISQISQENTCVGVSFS